MSVVDGASGASVVPAGKWSVDAPRSSVAFAVKHMVLATVNGRFREFDGMLELGSGAPRATGVVKAASIDTNESVRDEHLRR
jgi:polyisoprenoid-binding protein YceI